MTDKLGCQNPADLAVMYTDFYNVQVAPYTPDAIRFLELTTEGKQWIANLDSNLFQAGHRTCRIGPFTGAVLRRGSPDCWNASSRHPVMSCHKGPAGGSALVL